MTLKENIIKVLKEEDILIPNPDKMDEGTYIVPIGTGADAIVNAIIKWLGTNVDTLTEEEAQLISNRHDKILEYVANRMWTAADICPSKYWHSDANPTAMKIVNSHGVIVLKHDNEVKTTIEKDLVFMEDEEEFKKILSRMQAEYEHKATEAREESERRTLARLKAKYPDA